MFPPIVFKTQFNFLHSETDNFDLINGPWPCASPKGCLFTDSNLDVVTKDDLYDAIRIVCSNDKCPLSSYVHSSCFEAFEDAVLQFMRSCPRAKGWTEKQRVQNLWNKRGYDLVFKACECLCGHGHVRKDLDWIPPPPGPNMEGGEESQGRRRRKKSRNASGKSSGAVGLPMFGAAAVGPPPGLMASQQVRQNAISKKFRFTKI